MLIVASGGQFGVLACALKNAQKSNWDEVAHTCTRWRGVAPSGAELRRLFSSFCRCRLIIAAPVKLFGATRGDKVPRIPRGLCQLRAYAHASASLTPNLFSARAERAKEGGCSTR